MSERYNELAKCPYYGHEDKNSLEMENEGTNKCEEEYSY